jgi:hypothetical protein
MERRSVLGLVAMGMLGFSLQSGGGLATQNGPGSQLVGTWTLVSNVNVKKDGSTFEPFGSTPKGILTFDATNRFSLILVRPGRPKFASNNRLQSTPEEDRETVRNTLSLFGTYSVNESDRSFILKVEGSSFPNWEGAARKYLIKSLTAEDLKYRSPPTSTGAGYAELTWRRAT